MFRWSVPDSSSSASVLQPGLFFVPTGDILFILVSLRVWAILRARSFPVVQLFELSWVEWLGVVSSTFGNELLQSIPLRARLLSHHSNHRSTCARRRYRCLFSLAS